MTQRGTGVLNGCHKEVRGFLTGVTKRNGGERVTRHLGTPLLKPKRIRNGDIIFVMHNRTKITETRKIIDPRHLNGPWGIHTNYST